MQFPVAAAQVLGDNALMASRGRKEKVGWLIPTGVVDLAETVFHQFGYFNKGLVVSAGIVALLRMSEEERNRLVREVIAENGPGGDFARLLPGSAEKDGAKNRITALDETPRPRRKGR